MAAAPTPWTTIKQLYFRFAKHYLPIHDKLHRSLDIAYSSDLPDIDLLFTDGALQTTFRSDAIQIIKDEVINIIEPLATATVDITAVAPIVNVMPIYQHASGGLVRNIRTAAHLQAIFDTAIAIPTLTIVIILDLSVLHFTSLPNPQNFADMSKDPFPTPKAPAATVPAAPVGGALSPPAGSVPVANIFNYRALPSDVRLRFDQHAGHKMVT